MRFVFLCFLLLAASLRSDAQKTIDIVDSASGYLIRNAGDTLYRQILLPNDFSINGDGTCFARGVFTSDGSTQTLFQPADISGLGIKKRNIVVHYRRIQPFEGRKPFFARVVVLGGAVTLFQYIDIRTTFSAPGLAVGAMTRGQQGSFLQDNAELNLIISDSKGNMLRLENKKPAQLEKALVKFFEGDALAQDLAHEMVTSLYDVPAFVTELNRRKATAAAAPAR